MRQLGRRLGVTQQAVLHLESRERNDTITVGKLREVADALECDLRIAFVPRPSLEGIVRERANARVRDEQERVRHTMRLEAQADGVDFDDADRVEQWLSRDIRRLWD